MRNASKVYHVYFEKKHCFVMCFFYIKKNLADFKYFFIIFANYTCGSKLNLLSAYSASGKSVVSEMLERID